MCTIVLAIISIFIYYNINNSYRDKCYSKERFAAYQTLKYLMEVKVTCGNPNNFDPIIKQLYLDTCEITCPNGSLYSLKFDGANSLEVICNQHGTSLFNFDKLLNDWKNENNLRTISIKK